ncbi:hypothetical protein BC833DRAFT_583816 [Globomyces pollinis-pini]|nr:hypothetical protein BC833DRAFT_583816 [Globomyces pollinis-pini]
MSAIIKFALNATVVSCAFASLKRANGVELRIEKIENEAVRSGLTTYFWIGDFVLDQAAVQARKYPDWFKVRNP